MASGVFKILNKLSPSYIQDLVNEKVSHYNFRNKLKFHRSTPKGMA